MDTLLIVVSSFVLYLIAYHTYGRFLASRVFQINPDTPTPACTLSDGVDFVPSKKSLVFGHHFTSIAGTGPIVGPAIAVVWGWVPALIWVTLGSIFMGAVHDFGSLIISMRHQGRTIADLSGTVINARVRILFMVVVVIGLWIVLAIFGLVIATIFKLYPSSVVPVFLQIPIAVGLGIWIKRNGNLILGSLGAVGLMYLSIYWSSTSDLFANGFFPSAMTNVLSEIGWWTLILMVYVFIASVLPVDVLLQPRDFINSWQLLIAMGLLVIGILVAHPPIVADAVRLVPEVSVKGNPAPPMFPFLFITIACGAVSGFHCLVSSGCSSRQLKTEADAQAVGYGAMLTEGFLATLVIIACIAGIGMSKGNDGHAIWLSYYQQWGGDAGLGAKLTPVIRGSANMMESIGVSQHLGITLMGVFVASFAATTLDSATRLQRYVIAELAGGTEPHRAGPVRRLMINRFGATTIAVLTGLGLALSDAPVNGLPHAGLGGLTLWPIFGATNQLLAAFALLVLTVWLIKSDRPAWVSAVPMFLMVAITSYAIVLLIRGFSESRSLMLMSISMIMFLLQLWMLLEAGVLVFRKSLSPITNNES
ncbi:MAG: carbon starvation CstA family protein [Phycisphaerales bacterium]